ncbi:MAG: hypothetical protein HZA50_18095 [Planctomycetes bacterium]|nr:hypothetical protein [Planctomycetota bacterium]
MKNLVWTFAAVTALLLPPAQALEKQESSKPQDALGKTLTKVAIEGTVSSAIQDIARQAGVVIEVDWVALGRAGASDKARVSLKYDEATVSKLLRLCLEQAAKDKPLGWYASDKAIHITTQSVVFARQSADAPKSVNAVADKPKPMDLNFENVALADVLEFLREKTGLNFFINWNALQASGIGKDTPVSLKASGLSVAKVLNMILDSVSANKGKLERLYWIVEDGVVTITTGESLNQESTVRMFDIGDLLFEVPRFTSPRIDISSITSGTTGGGGSIFTPAPAAAGGDDRKQKMIDSITTAIKNTIGDDMWAPTGKGTISFINNTLVISQTKLGWKLLAGGLMK